MHAANCHAKRTEHATGTRARRRRRRPNLGYCATAERARVHHMPAPLTHLMRSRRHANHPLPATRTCATQRHIIMRARKTTACAFCVDANQPPSHSLSLYVGYVRFGDGGMATKSANTMKRSWATHTKYAHINALISCTGVCAPHIEHRRGCEVKMHVISARARVKLVLEYI